MSAWLTAVVGVLYLAIAVAHLHAGRRGLALAFFAYAVANMGLILAEKEMP
jgi:hypothetical protein